MLSDYTSPTIDLNDPAVFRDLSKPIGALHPPRLKQFVERYNLLAGTYTRPLFGSTYAHSVGKGCIWGLLSGCLGGVGGC